MTLSLLHVSLKAEVEFFGLDHLEPSLFQCFWLLLFLLGNPEGQISLHDIIGFIYARDVFHDAVLRWFLSLILSIVCHVDENRTFGPLILVWSKIIICDICRLVLNNNHIIWKKCSFLILKRFSDESGLCFLAFFQIFIDKIKFFPNLVFFYFVFF